MNNKQIALKFDLLAKLMELHDENPFKIRSYANAYLSLRKLEGDLNQMPKSELAAIKGVGTAIADKIEELLQSGEMKALTTYLDITPTGIQQMLSIKGLGPKKVKQIWKEMEITSVGELLYACHENRLVHYKGFGEKAQKEIKHRIEYFMDAQGKYLYAHVHKHADELVFKMLEKYPGNQVSICGDVRRMMPEVCGIEIITDITGHAFDYDLLTPSDDGSWTYHDVPVFIYFVSKPDFIGALFIRSCSEIFFEHFGELQPDASSEAEIFSHKGIRYIPSECRESDEVIRLWKDKAPELITVEDIKGIVHNHSTYSDGLHTLKDMSDYVKQCGYEYFVISDHSKSAGYAGGLQVEKLEQQWREIDALNAQYGPDFRIFKGIESDILSDGSLDYEEDVLKQFDVVIASVHSVLNMDEKKANDRLVKAIENPYTKILGHPTGRLLLARPGYPLDHNKIIDACAANNVVIELNANPQRLDIDWTRIPYCLDKGVMIAINPDAHSKESIHYIKYGVAMARKGGLTKSMCINTKSLSEFHQWVSI